MKRLSAKNCPSDAKLSFSKTNGWQMRVDGNLINNFYTISVKRLAKDTFEVIHKGIYIGKIEKENNL